jgi:hypothetical protein
MKPEYRAVALPSVTVLGTMAVLAGALGAFIAGLRGLQAGCVAGIALALLPFLADRVGRWLTRPDGLPRFVAREIGHAVISAAEPIVNAVMGPFATIGRLLHGPVVLMLVVGSILLDSAAMAFGSVGRIIATPLGATNLAALFIIASDVIGLSFSPLAIGVGLFALVLALLVTSNEASTDTSVH